MFGFKYNFFRITICNIRPQKYKSNIQVKTRNKNKPLTDSNNYAKEIV